MINGTKRFCKAAKLHRQFHHCLYFFLINSMKLISVCCVGSFFTKKIMDITIQRLSKKFAKIDNKKTWR